MKIGTLRSVVIGLALASAPLGAFARPQGPVPPPPPADDYSPSKWQLYAFEDGRYAARFPAKPTESLEPAPQGSRLPAKHEVRYEGVLTFRVSYADYGVVLEQRAKIEDLMQGMKGAMLRAESDPNAKIVEERYTTVGVYKALYFQIDEGTKSTLRLELVPVGTRVYVVSLAGRHGDPREFQGEDNFAEMAKAFFESFRVSEPAAAKP